MFYKCLECGYVFDEGEENRWNEPHGEKLSGCSMCNGSFAETKQCEICGEDFWEDELNGGCVCNNCIDEYRKEFDICYKIADDTKEEVKINALLLSLFDETEIEAILYQHLKEGGKVDCSAFIEQDKGWFAERLAEEVKKWK